MHLYTSYVVRYMFLQHAYVYIHELVRETSAAGAAGINRRGGAVSREAGMGLKRLRSWEFVQALQASMCIHAFSTTRKFSR